MQKCDKNIYPTLYVKITQYNHCIHNILIHILISFQVDCFTNKARNTAMKWQIAKKKL